ncbi:MAG: hypothetical protein ACLVL7_11395 [Anaerotruncus massiliensis (ex Togo et al. 2019)]
MRATTGTPGYCTVSFTPGGYDVAGRVPLTANTMVSGSIISRLGAQTWVGLHVATTDNNTPYPSPLRPITATPT